MKKSSEAPYETASRKYDSSKWGLKPEQHADLVAWCEGLIQRRSELLAERKKTAKPTIPPTISPTDSPATT